MSEELNTQDQPLDTLPPGDASPVDTPVKEPGESGPPENVPYERFKEVNEERKFLRDLVSRREAEAAPKAATSDPVAIPEPAFVPPPEPNESEYLDADGDIDYVKQARVMGRYGAQVAMAEAEHKRQVERGKTTAQETVAKATNFVQKVSAKFTDFQDSIRISGNPSDDVAAAIIAMNDTDPEIAEAVAYHLAKNPGEMARVNNLSPLQATTAVGRLAEKLVRLQPDPKKISDAPNPTNPVKNTTKTDTFDPSKASPEELMKHHPATPAWCK